MSNGVSHDFLAEVKVTVFITPWEFLETFARHGCELTDDGARRTHSSARAIASSVSLTVPNSSSLNTALTVSAAGGVIPVNAVTPIVGAPVIMYIMLRKRF